MALSRAEIEKIIERWIGPLNYYPPPPDHGDLPYNEWPEVRARAAKRRELFGFNPLNEYFEGADGHHIDKINVVYIPRKLHQSIRHSQKKSHSMIRINRAAMKWIERNNIPILAAKKPLPL